ncbi:MAG: PAS domain-containing protein [Gemmataceae bacterium]|nr:PAS domain-containing protein [Gemmataceae bacterium]
MQTNGQTRAGRETADGILTVDEHGIIESLNPVAARLFGYTLDEVTGRPLALLIPVLGSDRFEHRLAPYLQQRAGSNGPHRLEGQRKNGSPLPLELVAGASPVGTRHLFTVLVRDLTPREWAKTALGEGCDLLDILMDNLPDSIYFKDTASRFIRINRASADRFGLNDPAEAIGKTDVDFFTEEHAQQAYADEQELMRTGQPVVDLEEKETWPDGRVTWVCTTKMPLRDPQGRIVGTFGISRDITDRKQTEAERHTLTRFLDSIIDNLPIMLFIKDAEHLRFQRLNKAGEELLGYPRQQLLGKSDYDFFPQAEADFFSAKDYDVLRGQQLVDIPEEEIATRHGKRILHTRKIPLLDENGKPTHLVGISEDITQAKQTAEALHKAKEAAEAANRAKSEFLANVSHEIRTPMNGILGMTELALDTELEPEQREFLTMVKASADALLDVINDILDFSKMEAGKLDLDTISFPLRDSLGDTMKTLALRAHKKGLELASWVLPEVPDHLVGDPGRLRQIIVNLVGNAIKFTEQGEVVVRVEPVSQTAEEATLHFAVRDTGIGIPRAKQQAIFAPFVQADGSTTRKYGGTGLGLAISARLVELMGGRIWVESEPGQGSTFHFTVRFGLARGPAVPAPRRRPASLQGLPVLVVDDNATNRRILEEILTNWRMKPTLVDSGRAALAEIQRSAAAGEPYPLVLLDLMMPEMDGYTLAAQMKQHPEFGGSTIMMLSSAEGSAARNQELGIAACLMKPIKQSELFDAIVTSLGVSLPEDDQPTAAAQAPAPASPQHLRVLLAEDNAVNQKLAIRLLEKRGHRVVVAGTGNEALAALERERFDVVLMDVQMPELDGFETTAAIRAHEQGTGAHLPIVAMTAHAMKGDRERCLEVGMDGYVSKPLQANELFEVVESLVGARAPAPEHAGTERSTGKSLDVAAALKCAGGDRELLRELAALFCADYPQRMTAIRNALDQSNARQLMEAAHALKGAMGAFGPSAAFDAALQLEILARQGNLSGSEPVYGRLREEIEHFVPGLEDLARGKGI